MADTSLSLMAFMLQGHVPGRAPYGKNMDRAISYLVAVGRRGQSGYLGTPNHHGGMYEHGLAILALSEAWGQSLNPEIGYALKRAVEITINAQNQQGGWRYTPEPRDADLSMTVMQIVAINSAKEAGIQVSLCGEMAAEARYLPVLLGLGFEDLSMNPVAIPAVKRTVATVSVEKARSVVEKALQMPSAKDIAALVEKTRRALNKHKLRRLAIGGGVAANSALRSAIASQFSSFDVRIPPMSLCTDNAGMIAALGYHLRPNATRDFLNLNADANLKLTHNNGSNPG